MDDTRKPPAPPDTRDILADRIADLEVLFPELFTEGHLDLEKVRSLLGTDLSDSPERYILNWAGRRDAIGILRLPSHGALVPRNHESINFETTKDVFIEGENLEVLKLLYKAYFGRVKMIY